jgi:hypothetical protein
MHGSAPWKTEETIVGLPRLLVFSVFSRFGDCHLSTSYPEFVRSYVAVLGNAHADDPAGPSCDTDASVHWPWLGRIVPPNLILYNESVCSNQQIRTREVLSTAAIF